VGGVTGSEGRVLSAVSDEIVQARAFLSRVAEPACVPLWGYVRDVGPVTAVRDILTGRAPRDVLRATGARAATVDAEADLAAAQRRGIRLVMPESPDWPHFAMACLERTGLSRLAEYRRGETAHSDAGEPVPPLALWVRGCGDLATLAVRSVGIVGARAATGYGERVAADLAFGLAARGFGVVSGGAYGIDAAAHRGALGARGLTYLVSAGGLDAAYPPAHTTLFDRCAESGLVISESPPGAAPRRRRFLTRNRLIAALSTGSVVVEASARSGAMNTAGHCGRLGRPLLVVPGPVTSAMSVGCHLLLRRLEGTARLVTSVDDVLEIVGTLSDVGEGANAADPSAGNPQRGPRPGAADVRDRLDRLDDAARTVFDSFPARAHIRLDDLVSAAGLPVAEVLRSLPTLEVAGLVERQDDGYCIRRSERRGT
jgi:DNA processing protein